MQTVRVYTDCYTTVVKIMQKNTTVHMIHTYLVYLQNIILCWHQHRVQGNPINGGPKFLYLPLNLTLTLTLTLLTLLLSTMFNMVQEFGTAVYRIAECSIHTDIARTGRESVSSASRMCTEHEMMLSDVDV